MLVWFLFFLFFLVSKQNKTFKMRGFSKVVQRLPTNVSRVFLFAPSQNEIQSIISLRIKILRTVRLHFEGQKTNRSNLLMLHVLYF